MKRKREGLRSFGEFAWAILLVLIGVPLIFWILFELFGG